MTREPGRAPPRHAHGDLTSLAPHERLPEILVVPRDEGDIWEIYLMKSSDVLFLSGSQKYVLRMDLVYLMVQVSCSVSVLMASMATSVCAR